MDSDSLLRVAIPPAEEDNLLLTFAEAMEMADEGDAEGGYDLLRGGLCRAEDLAAGGEEWGGALAARYRHALERYTEQYGRGPG